MNGHPAVSVLMSAYNAAPYLRESVGSILSQTFRDLELVIVDDGSTDDSREVLSALAAQDARVRVFRNEKNQGLAAAHNRGLREARGDLLARQDADDVSVAHRLAVQVEFMRDHPEVDVLGSQLRLIQEDKFRDDIFDPPLRHGLIVWNLLFDRGVTHGTSMVRRRAFDAVGGYRGTYRHVEDLDLWIRMAGLVRFANLPEPLLHYRILPDSFTRSHRIEQAHEIVGIRREYASWILGSLPAFEHLRMLRDFVKQYQPLLPDEQRAVRDLLLACFRALKESGRLDAEDIPLVEADLRARLSLLDADCARGQGRSRLRSVLPRPLYFACMTLAHPLVALRKARILMMERNRK